MVKRVLVGVIFVPLIIALILFAPAWAFACFAALITSFASWELLHAVAKLPARLYVYTSLAAAVLPFGFLAGRYAGVLTLGFTALALFAPYAEIVGGSFSLPVILYYLSVIGVFLFFTGQTLERRRWN